MLGFDCGEDQSSLDLVEIELQTPEGWGQWSPHGPLGGSWGLLHLPSSWPCQLPRPEGSAQAGVDAPTRALSFLG